MTLIEILLVAQLLGVGWITLTLTRLTRRGLDHAVITRVSEISAEAQMTMQELLRTELAKFASQFRSELRPDMDNLHARLEHLEQAERVRQSREAREDRERRNG